MQTLLIARFFRMALIQKAAKFPIQSSNNPCYDPRNDLLNSVNNFVTLYIKRKVKNQVFPTRQFLVAFFSWFPYTYSRTKLIYIIKLKDWCLLEGKLKTTSMHFSRSKGLWVRDTLRRKWKCWIFWLQQRILLQWGCLSTYALSKVSKWSK